MSEVKRIFIADDDEAALTSLSKLLILSGFEVETTKNPKEVIQKVKFFKPQIILLDLLMPALGGLELCEMLNSDKETQGIPVIIISALGGYTDIKKAYHLGVVGYFTKPYEFTQLLQEIRKTIASKEGGKIDGK